MDCADDNQGNQKKVCEICDNKKPPQRYAAVENDYLIVTNY
jgi:hypothetical protein